ncbi:hypothetical protein G9A89_011626 [Geosiphon pyriformis]|nr:hypothetical protein G9A89_011626 [Geosiphon pyriformis]
MHPVDLPTTITHARDFEAAKLEANYAQAVNLVMNGSFDLNSKLKQFSDTINQKLEGYLADNCAIYQLPQRRNNSENMNRFQNQLHPLTLLLSSLPNQPWQPEMRVCHNCGKQDATTNNSESNPPQTTLTNNILPVTVTENESLTAIFPFKLEETINSPLFSGTALEEKPITVMYTDAKVDGHSIKLILDSGSAGSIITRQLINQLGCQVDCTASARIITADRVTKTPIEKIDDFSIEVNGIIVPIKILVIKATQY